MIDETWRLQGWAKLMRPTATKLPTKAELRARQKAQEEWDKRADEAEAWVRSRFSSEEK